MKGPFTLLPPQPNTDDKRQWNMWFNHIHKILSGAPGIAWLVVDKAGSKLTDIETRLHSMLQEVKGWATGTDTTKDRHISDAIGKVWQDHVEVTNGNPHGADHAMLDALEEDDHPQYLLLAGRTGQRAVTPLKFGGDTNYSDFEANGFLHHAGNAGGYDDVQFNITPKETGAGHPTLNTWNTDFKQFSYAVGDYANAASQEAPHWWLEASDWHFHIHWSTGSGNYVSGDKVQFEIKISGADSRETAPYAQFPTATVLTAEHTFNSTVLPFSAVRTRFPVFTVPASMQHIGAQVVIRIARIAKSAGGTNPATDPFPMQVGAHAISDTRTSRTNGAK